MSLKKISKDQPDSFEFSEKNLEISKKNSKFFPTLILVFNFYIYIKQKNYHNDS